MKKILQKSGVPANKEGVDYLKKLRNTPGQLIKRDSLQGLINRVEQARAEKMKKAS